MSSAFVSRTAISRFSPRRARLGAAAASAAAVLALTGCSGDGDDGSARSTPSATVTADTGGGTGGTGPGASPSQSGSAKAVEELEGSWLTTTGGDAVVLMVNGTEAGLFATGGTVCSGSAGEEDGERFIRLTCTDGDKDRTTGTVESVKGGTLKVTWAGGAGTESYVRAEGGTLPSGLPTEGLGS